MLDETRLSYLRRVLPDIQMIESDVISAAQFARRESDFALNSAITRTERLLTDLQRAYDAD